MVVQAAVKANSQSNGTLGKFWPTWLQNPERKLIKPRIYIQVLSMITHANPRGAGTARMSRRTRDVTCFGLTTFFFLYTCDRAAPSPVDQFGRMDMLFGSRLVWVQETIFRLGWTSSPPVEYDGSICAAAMQTVATITLATCSSCRRAALNLENDSR